MSVICKYKHLLHNSIPIDDRESYIYYECLDETNKQVFSKNDICFRDLSLNTIPLDYKFIRIHRDKSRIPYNENSISKWIAEINQLGFYCTFFVKDTVYYFVVEISKFGSKPHLIYTLQLIRAMFERGLCYVPEIYFSILEENPNIDKFQALQNAHKDIYHLRPFVGANPNHAVTSIYNGKNVSKAEFINRLNKSPDAYTKKSVCYERLWNGDMDY